MDVYVGVSAGSVITAGLANGLKPNDIFQLFIENKATNKSLGALKPEVFLRPAYREYWRRAKTVPPLFLRALWRYLTHPLRGSALESFAALSRALPTGLFDNDAVRKYLAAAFNEPGRTDDFRQLKHKLFSIATDLDTGESVRFGGPGLDHIPISRAVQASSALPGLFPPVKIDGHYYVDGALKKNAERLGGAGRGRAAGAVCESFGALRCQPGQAARQAGTGEARRRRSANGALANFSRHHPFAHACRFAKVRHPI